MDAAETEDSAPEGMEVSEAAEMEDLEIWGGAVKEISHEAEMRISDEGASAQTRLCYCQILNQHQQFRFRIQHQQFRFRIRHQ